MGKTNRKSRHNVFIEDDVWDEARKKSLKYSDRLPLTARKSGSSSWYARQKILEGLEEDAE